MRSFDFKKEYTKLLTPDIVALLTQIHEYKVQQNLFIEVNQDALTELIETAKMQSSEASNRIEGIIITEDRLKKLIQDKTILKNRSEREIAGYRDVLSIIQENYEYIPIRPGMILQLHRDLYKYIEKKLPDVSFYPAEVWKAQDAITELCAAFNDALNSQEMDPLLLIPMFILDFLCIHPFYDGNGRMSRLFTLLMLYRSGYFVGKYVSIEKMIAESKETYYEVLQESSYNWHEESNNYAPFVHYMLGLVDGAYREFNFKADLLINRGFTKPERIREIIKSTPGKITKTEIMARCPDISQVTVQRTLNDLLKSNEIIKLGGGRYTSYVWNEEKE